MLPLDGRKLFPINHGKSSEETFLQVRRLHLFSEPVMRTKKGLMLETLALKLLTVGNLHYQLS